METFPEDPFAMLKARIVSGDERMVMGSRGVEGGWCGGDHRKAVFG